jgi:hypothetical protein
VSGTRLRSNNPLHKGRRGQPLTAQGREKPKTVLYLASDDVSFITGIELFIDGGSTFNHVHNWYCRFILSPCLRRLPLFPRLQAGMDGRKNGVRQFICRRFSLPAPLQRGARDRPTNHGGFQLR